MERQTWISPFGQEDILDEHDASDLVQVENSLQDDWQLDTYFGAVPKWLWSHGLVVLLCGSLLLSWQSTLPSHLGHKRAIKTFNKSQIWHLKRHAHCVQHMSLYLVIQPGFHCTMVPLSTRICLKSNKLRPILNGQFCHAISKNICLNVFGSKQPWEILVFVIFKL